MFLKFLIKNNIDNKLYLLGFILAIIAYSFWKPIENYMEFSEENSGTIFYLGIALSFCCYTSAYMFTKYDTWRFLPMFVTLICLSRVGSEIYYIRFPNDNPENYSIFDYINFLITIWVVFNYYVKWKHDKYKKNETKRKSDTVN